ncbi:hypothetical protein [Oryzobacter telluris]|uniref:sunset domain-containing protein n=1 Tax=Oryzobacter telluris TaxID=3149179 RepID=UPI00370D46D0
MPTGRLILLLLIVVAVVLVILWLMRRGSSQREAQRVEAAELRGRAEEIAATMGGQQAFAQQTEERAAVARAEAEQRAQEAARLEQEAAEQRAAADATQREYEAQMRRADDVDPDVKESSFAPVPTEDAAPAVEAGRAGAADTDADDADDDRAVEGEAPMTRAERRAAREQAESQGSWSAAPVAAAAGAGAVAAASAHHDDEDHDADSERVASAADYRDDVTPEGDTRPTEAPSAPTTDAVPAADDSAAGHHVPDGEVTEARAEAGDDDAAPGVSAAAAAGTGAGMSDDTREHDPAHTDLSHDVESPSGEWGGPRSDDAPAEADATDHGATDAGTATSEGDATPDASPDGPTIIGDIEDYASTEPLLAEDQTAPVESDAAASDETSADADTTSSDEHTSLEDAAPTAAHDTPADADEEATTAPHDTLAADADEEPAAAHDVDTTEEAITAPHDTLADDAADEPASSGEGAERGESTQERFDPTPTRDWAADEGELLEENRARGEALEEDRTELASEEPEPVEETAHHDAVADEAPSDHAGTPADEAPAETSASDDTTSDDATSDDAPGADESPVTERAARRVSEFHELRDGGYGVGSAATLDDGAQPLDHPVQGFRDSMTARVPGDAGYDDGEPDVWFYDEAAAERNGFRRSQD